MKKVILIAMLSILSFSCVGYASDASFIRQDREMLIRLDEWQKAINKRIDDLRSELKGDIANLRGELQGDIADLRNLTYVVLAGIFAIFSFVLWDRRTTLAPAVKKNRELEEREDKIERVLKELAIKDEKVADALKHAGIL
ncbi:BdrC3 [Candidatus Scalindua japonica]|uniref:BdrC3 n=1 Tax=Candidatus Scalindua japonica TaxID=1284222 RepID=A0A286U0W1_9BACT|nr:hypothetical protein [Candidatus Scalindua japonica]GAX61796.1 hypothetical protein SCALIN_C27_0195 [Candidatus Scalindua japonica]GAX61800.1 BdrC3 [Candidatus Scalindua japonica]